MIGIIAGEIHHLGEKLRRAARFFGTEVPARS